MKTKRGKANAIRNGRWAAYATAAAASSLTATKSAEASIHYSGMINQRVTADDVFAFELGSGGVTFKVSHDWIFWGSSTTRIGGKAYFRINGPGAAFRGTFGCPNAFYASASRLNLRDPISKGPFATNKGILGVYYGECYFDDGKFLDRGFGFVGFKFNTGAGDQYGWARIYMEKDAVPDPDFKFKLVDYAYGDPGEKVVAGQRENNSGSTPVLESLGGLALGGVGLLAWRRKRERAARQ